MLRAYFDRSELVNPAPVVAVGGYVTTDEKWTEFESAWKQVLDDFGVSMFHMVDFECRHGEFANWLNDRRTAFIRQLIDVVHHALAGIAVGMRGDN